MVSLNYLFEGENVQTVDHQKADCTSLKAGMKNVLTCWCAQEQRLFAIIRNIIAI